MPSFVRIYSGDDGQSHMEEFEPDFSPFTDTEGAHGDGTPVEPAAASLPRLAKDATGVTIRRNPPGYFLDWHCAPRRQYSISLAGEVEIGTGDGTVKRFGPGTVMLAEDLTGQGHTTRVVGNETRLTILIPLTE